LSSNHYPSFTLKLVHFRLSMAGNFPFGVKKKSFLPKRQINYGIKNKKYQFYLKFNRNVK